MESEHPVSNDCHFENCSSRAIKEEPPQEVDCGNGGGPEITFVEVKEERVQDDTEQEDKSDNDPIQENLNRMSREPKPGEVCEVYVKSEYSVMDHTDEMDQRFNVTSESWSSRLIVLLHKPGNLLGPAG